MTDRSARLIARKLWLWFDTAHTTATITLIYVLFAGAQWCAIRGANEISNETLQLSQRPWVAS
jgi:hypothetical protein